MPPLHPKGSTVVWIVRAPRTVPLIVEARPVGETSAKPFRVQLEPDRGTSGTYTGIIAVGGTGCWQLVITWADQVAEMELDFQGP